MINDELKARAEQLIKEIRASVEAASAPTVSCPIPMAWARGEYDPKTKVLTVHCSDKEVDIEALPHFIHHFYPKLEGCDIIFRPSRGSRR